jgi:hypothetical protein
MHRLQWLASSDFGVCGLHDDGNHIRAHCGREGVDINSPRGINANDTHGTTYPLMSVSQIKDGQGFNCAHDDSTTAEAGNIEDTAETSLHCANAAGREIQPLSRHG